MLLGAIHCDRQSSVPARPRAIILISLDTLRADFLGSYGHTEHPTTPFLDDFARKNVVFENSFIVEPRTLTSLMSLMTGLYPQHHQVQDARRLPDEIPTLAALLKEQGYRTRAFTSGGYLDRR